MHIRIRIQLKFNVGFTFITHWTTRTYQWCVKGIEDAIAAHKPIIPLVHDHYRYNEYGHFSEVNDVNDLQDADRDICLKHEIRSFIYCSINDEDQYLGCVGFDSAFEPRVWTKQEHLILNTVADVMGKVLLQHSVTSLATERNIELRAIINGSNRMV